MFTMVGLAGLGLAGVGLAHSAKPDAFESITAQAFPENAQQHLYMDEGQAKLWLNSGLIAAPSGFRTPDPLILGRRIRLVPVGSVVL
jgi:hypothetical protein